MKKRLKHVLSEFIPHNKAMQVSNSYDIIGDIAVIRLPPDCKDDQQEIAQAIMSIHKNVKTVMAQTSAVQGEYRTRRLVRVAGEERSVTQYMESGCVFSVDVTGCYFSPRLSYERMRVAKQIKNGEVVVNMFAGVGCFSLIIARHSDVSKLYSIDINPIAFKFMEKNVRINRVYGKVIPLLGDAKEIIETRLCHSADRVLMPLPEKALEYLPSAVSALKENGGWIHYYDFEHAGKGECPVEKNKLKVAAKLRDVGVPFGLSYGRVVRPTGPNWHQIALDISCVTIVW